MLPATKLGNIDRDLGDFAPEIRLRDLDRSAQEHEKDVNFPICKVEMDLDNVASAQMGATVTATSEYSTYVDDYIIDGQRTHKDGKYWQSGYISNENGYFGSDEYCSIKIIFPNPKTKINRIKIYSYPKKTLTDGQKGGIKEFVIKYALEGESQYPTHLWTNLKDAGGGEGSCEVSGGYVINNTRHFNILQDDIGIECEALMIGIRYTEEPNDRARLCEVEVYRTIQLQDEEEIAVADLETGNITKMGQNRIQVVEVDRRKDWEFHRFQGARLNLSLLNYDKKFSPDYSPTYDEVTNKGYFNDDIRDELAIRLWLGFDMRGYQELVPAGEFYIKTWNVDPANETVSIIAKDKVAKMKDVLVEIASSILENKYVEYLIEWIALRCNISADELHLDDTSQEIPYFFPRDKMSWETCQDLAESLGDAGLFFNEYDRLRHECYMGQIPHEWEQTTQADWEAGTKTDTIDITSEPGSYKLTKDIWSGENLIASQTVCDSGLAIYWDSLYDKCDVAQSFKVNQITKLTRVKFYLEKTGSPANLKVSLKADDNNSPGTTLTSVTIPASSVGTSPSWIEADITDYEINPDTKYWWYLECENYVALANYTWWGSSYNTYNDGNWWDTDSGHFPNKDGSFLIYGEYKCYQPSGNLLSQQHDCSAQIIAWGKLNVSQTLNGQTVIWKTMVSANGTDWDAEVEVDANFMIMSAVKQYIKVRSYLSRTNIYQTPIVHSFIVNYYTGGGTLPPEEVSFNFHYDGTLLGIKQTLSSEAGGKCQVYKKAIVKAKPYYKQDYEKVWEGDVPFTVNDGQEAIYYCELNDPCAPNTTGADQMKLWVNGAYRDADGNGMDTSIGNLTIYITRHPTIAFVKFVASGGNVTIDSFWIDAKPFKQTGIIQAVAEASLLNQERYRGRDFTYENDYLYVKAIAESIASTIIETYAEPRPRVTDDIPVRYCPQVQIMDRVNIKELNSGISQDYQIFGYKHKLQASKGTFKAETSIQAKEL